MRPSASATLAASKVQSSVEATERFECNHLHGLTDLRPSVDPPWIECILQSIGKEVDADDYNDNGQAGENAVRGSLVQVALRIG